MEDNEVVQKVKKAIEELGATSKANYDELNKKHEELKSVIKAQGESDPITQDHLTKLADDVTTRQDSIDKEAKAAQDRIDAIEVALKRSPQSGGKEGESLHKEAKDFFCANLSTKGNFTWAQAQAMEVDVEAYKSYTKAFETLLRKGEQALSPDQYKAMLSGSDPDGGYTVTPFMSARIVERLFESDPIRQLATTETISTDAIELMEDYSEAGVGWEGETVANAESGTPQMGKKRIPVHVLAARPSITQTLIDDSGINIEAWLSNKVADKMSRHESAAFVTGDGVAKPRGFLDYGNWDTAGTYKHGAIERVNMGHATQFTTDGLMNIKYAMVEQYLNKGTWVTNRLNVRDIMKLKDGDGQYIWRPGIEMNQPSLLLGLPLRMATTVPTTAASALAIALADWKETYMIVDRQGINIQRDPFTVKPFVEFYTRKRVGGDVVNYQSIKVGVVSA